MTDPWFDPNHWAWLPGTLLGCLGGLWGSVVGICVPLRRGKSLVYGLGLLLAGLTAISAVAGLIALADRQPFAVWFFLLVPALPEGIICFVALCFLPRMYRFAEANYSWTEQSTDHS